LADLQPPFFFLHVMKTGGTTLAFDLLGEMGGAVYPSELDRRTPDDVEPYISVAHVLRAAAARPDSIRLYSGHFAAAVCELMPMELRTLTLLRDPVERTISVLKHFKARFERYGSLTLEQIYDDAFVFEYFVHDHQTKLFSATPGDRIETFVSRLTHAENLDRHRGLVAADRGATFTVDAERLERANAALAGVPVVGVTERYADFVEDLRARFGWWPEGAHPEARANVSTQEWPASSALRGRIAGDNRYDLDFYDYARGLIEGRAGSRP
jgi:hypothetical protein